MRISEVPLPRTAHRLAPWGPVATADPGTTLTSFTKPIIGSPKPDASKGIFTPEQAVEKMLEVISQARREMGGKGEVAGRGWGGTFRDWKGEEIGY